MAPGDGIVRRGADGLDLLATGIERAEMVNTVRPGYARESVTAEFGFGLDRALRAKGDRYRGILNGLDTTVWNPATDTDLAATYGPDDLPGKAACRADLLTRLGFDATDDAPVLGMIGRLDPQKGFDLLADATPRLLAAGARLAVQGSGDPKISAALRSLAAERPDRVALVERFDPAITRRIYESADIFSIPSRLYPARHDPVHIH